MKPTEIAFKKYEDLRPFFDKICKLFCVLQNSYALQNKFKIIDEDELHSKKGWYSRNIPWKRNPFSMFLYTGNISSFKYFNCTYEYPILRLLFSYFPFGNKPRKTQDEMTSENEKKILKNFSFMSAYGDSGHSKGDIWQNYYTWLMFYHTEIPALTNWSAMGWNHYALDPRLYTDLYNWLMSIAKNPIMKYNDIFTEDGEPCWWVRR